MPRFVGKGPPSAPKALQRRASAVAPGTKPVAPRFVAPRSRAEPLALKRRGPTLAPIRRPALAIGVHSVSALALGMGGGFLFWVGSELRHTCDGSFLQGWCTGLGGLLILLGLACMSATVAIVASLVWMSKSSGARAGLIVCDALLLAIGCMYALGGILPMFADPEHHAFQDSAAGILGGLATIVVAALGMWSLRATQNPPRTHS